MKAMITGLLTVAVIAITANFLMNGVWYSSAEYQSSSAVRLD